MSWLKMTSKSLFLMKGGTNEYLEKVDLNVHGVPTNEEFDITVPTGWLTGSNAPRMVVIDFGSTEKPNKAKASFDADDVYKAIVDRSAWGADAPTSRFEIVDRPTYIVIHHTEGTPSAGGVGAAKGVAKSIQTFHMNPEPLGRGWSDIGYNFLNMVDGILVEGRNGSLAEAIRGNSVRGAHAGTDDGNRSPGVSSEGNFMTKSMDTKQWSSLVNMCAALCQSCNIDPAMIRGHRDFVPNDCPGDWLYNRLPQLIKEVAEKLAS
jgi:hypothetical protein